MRVQLTQRFGDNKPGDMDSPIHVLTPFYRDGYSTVARLPHYFLQVFCKGDTAKLHTALPYKASADLIWLAARLRAAQKKGDAARVDVPESLLARRSEWEKIVKESPSQQADFIRKKLPELRAAIDRVAAEHPQVAFLSFADSVVLKSNWTTGFFKSPFVKYEPETILKAFGAVRAAYQTVTGLNVYGVFTQGANEFSEEQLMHVATTGNHVCMNSFGGPFADLKAIEETARQAIREKAHEPSELYMDLRFYHSLERKAPMHPQRFAYRSVITGVESQYVCAKCDQLLPM